MRKTTSKSVLNWVGKLSLSFWLAHDIPAFLCVFIVVHTQSFMFQLLKSLNYIHSLGICHRDLKPHNVLVDPETSLLKLCDFGSAKVLVPGEPNVSYISSRYYRAPELIFGACEYTSAIGLSFLSLSLSF